MADRKEKPNSKTKNGNAKRRRSKKIEEPGKEEPHRPLRPNVFLYIQLVDIKRLPQTINSLELHLSQGNNVIVKCEEHYNTSGVIYQEEFDSRPTFTLIIPQDNIERINDVSDNPLLVKLIMRITPKPILEEGEEGETVDDIDYSKDSETDDVAPSNIINQIVTKTVEGKHVDNESDEEFGPDYRLELLSVGFVDLLKMFAKRRSLVKKELYLYPVPTVPNEIRVTTITEWHFYTLLPLIREITIVNLAFITFESIYNVSEGIRSEVNEFVASLKFRSTELNARTNKYVEIPLCHFQSLPLQSIINQYHYHIFDTIRLEGYASSSVHGLQSCMEVEMHKLFLRLMRSKDFVVDFDYIDVMLDEAYVSNSFHRFVLTKDMSNILFWVVSCHKYVIAVEIFKASEPGIKLFEGLLDPAVLAYPNVQNMRFAVPLKNIAAPMSKRMMKRSTVSIHSDKPNKDTQNSPTFAIIKICLFSPIGEINEQLRVFNETFLSENRLLFCDEKEKETYQPAHEDLLADIYRRFDHFIEDTISYIISRCVHSIEERKSHFCCSLQNLRNVLMKIIGADYNRRVLTKDNLEFTNLCVDAYNELELRVHKRVELFNYGGFNESAINHKEEIELIIDYMNTIKFLHEVDEMTMADLLLNKIKHETKTPEILNFYILIDDMERQRFDDAKTYFLENTHGASSNYFSGWIKVYLDYLDNMNNEDTHKNALEFLLRDITAYSEQHAKQIDGWILLYCYYKRHNYMPGMDYARWRYSDYMMLPRDSTSGTPYSLCGMYLSHTPEFKTRTSEVFYEVVRIFQRLGIYDFAKVIFETIKNDCREVDRYLISSTLDILNKTLYSNTPVCSFPTEETPSGEELDGYINQTNGNIEYYRENQVLAKSHYEKNIDQPVSSTDRDYFLLSTIRLAYTAFNSGDYMQAIRALSKPIAGNLLTCFAYYMMGRSYYKLGDMPNAIKFLSKSTTINIHIPDIWGYLALINLRTQNIYNALECWKYAKIDPINVINEEIYEELEEIDYDKVDLYIDMPNEDL